MASCFLYRRREFMTLLGGAVAWPFTARAQQPAMPVIGFLNGGSSDGFAPYIAAFRQGLKEAGYVEGQNTTIEYRWAEGRNDRLPELATDLVGRRVTVIATPGGLPEALAAKAVAGSIPVVFGTGADPVQAGLVASLARPGGNVTGVTAMNAEVGAKRLGLLLELVPAAKSIAVLVNPANPLTEPFIADVQTGASVTGRQLDLFRTRSSRDIDAAFGELVQKRAHAIVVGPDTLFRDRRVQLATLTARHALPAIYAVRENVDAGGLMSYGSSFTDLARQAGIYTGRVLKGEKPADLPILRATKFELIINLQTAKVLGLDVPPTLRARADEVIE